MGAVGIAGAGTGPDDLIFRDGFESGDVQAWSSSTGYPDTSAPVLSDLFPVDGSWVTTATPTISASYSDAGTGVLESSVVLAVDGVDRTAEASVTASGISWSPTAALEGIGHEVSLFLTDGQANPATANWGFSIDAIPPSIGLQAVDRFDPATAILIGYADLESGLSPDTLRVFLDGAEITPQCSPQGGYSICQPPRPLPPGAHTATAEIRDLAQNLGASTHTFVAEPDLEAPEIRFVALPAILVNTAALAVEIDLFDSGRGIEPGSFELELDGLAVAGCVVDVGHASCSLSGLGEGERELAATVFDRAGNAANGAAGFEVVLDLEGPEIRLSPAGGAVLVNPQGVRLEAHYEDVELGLDPTSVAIHADGIEITAGCAIDSWGAVCHLPAPADGTHSWSVSVADTVANVSQADAAFEVVTDLEPPSVTIVAPLAGVHHNLTSIEAVLSVTDAGVGIDDSRLRVRLDHAEVTALCARSGATVSCAPMSVPPGPHELAVEVGDDAGNVASAAVQLEIVADSVAPVIRLSQPASGLLTGRGGESIVFEIEEIETAIAPASLEVALNGVPLICAIELPRVACDVGALPRGAATASASVADLAGNSGAWSGSFDVVRPLTVEIAEPVDELATAASTIRVAGTVEAGANAVEVNGEPAILSGTTFSHDAVPLRDGTNFIEVVARDATGSAGFDRVYVLVDRTPPQFAVSSPTDGEVVREPRVDVLGLVNDLTLGTIHEPDVEVTVNGLPAEVRNRSFSRLDLPLSDGANPIEVVATSASGTAAASLTVIFEPPVGDRLALAGGNGQTAVVGELLPEPLAVRLTDALGAPIAGRGVVFRVAAGNGRFADGSRARVVTSDAEGVATTLFRLGDRSGVGFNRVRATVAGAEGVVTFSASALPGPADQILVVAGHNQRGGVGEELAIPLTVVVLDEADNPVSGAELEFSVAQGSGTFGGLPVAMRVSDASGRARARFELGVEHGFDEPQFVRAALVGSVKSVLFEAIALRSTTGATSVSGAVLDNQGDPVPGVTLRLRDEAPTTTTSADGTFVLSGLAPGHQFLIVDALTAARPGMWASLELELFVVEGVDNPLGRPIYVLPLDLAGGILVSETTGGAIEIDEHPGFRLEVAPGSAVFPGGGRSGLISATLVHPDRIPMAPAAGMQPRVVATIQPAGTLFDPPARLTLPNLEVLTPGSVSEMFSFDHDLGAFVSIGTGTVSEDGLTIRSDPGFGVLEAGWHCVARPTPPGSAGAARMETDLPPLRVCRNEGLDVGGALRFRLNTNFVSWLPAAVGWSIEGGGTAAVLTESTAGAVCENGSPISLCPGKAQCSPGFEAIAPGSDSFTMTATCCQTGQSFGPASREVIVSEPGICWLDPGAPSLTGGEACVPSSPAPVAMQVNDDDDNQNAIADFRESPSAAENDLRPFVPRYQSGAQGMNRFVTWREVIPPGQESKLRLWLRDQPGVQWPPGRWLSLSDPPPVALVEAMRPSLAQGDAGIQLQYVESEDEAPPADGALNPFCGKAAAFTIYRIDLDIDSLNSEGFGTVGSSADADAVEDTHSPERPFPGKLVETNDDDDDKDWITDFADGFDFFSELSDDAVNAQERFVPVEITLPPGSAVDRAVARIELSYAGPAGILPSATLLEPTSWDFDLPEVGTARLWRKDGNLARNSALAPVGDFVPPGSYSLEGLGFPPGGNRTVLYLEATRPSVSVADLRISARLDPDGPGPFDFVAADAVRVTAVALRLSDPFAEEPAVTEIEGGGIAWISPDPEMPRLEASIEPGGLGAAFEFACRFEMDFDRRPGRVPPAGDLVELPPGTGPAVPLLSGASWPIWSLYDQLPDDKRYFGGDGFVECLNQVVALKKEFRLRGRNPATAEARAFIDSWPQAPWFAYAIAKYESRVCGGSQERRYNQFDLRVGKFGTPCADLSLRPDGTHNDGWGVFQVDLGWTDRDVPDLAESDYLSATQLWNWRELAEKGLAKVEAMVAYAEDWMNAEFPRHPGGPLFPHGQRPQSRIDPDVDGHGEYICIPRPGPNPGVICWIEGGAAVSVPREPAEGSIGEHCVFEDGTERTVEDAVAIKAYNGATTNYCSWDGVADAWSFSRENNNDVNYVERVCLEVE